MAETNEKLKLLMARAENSRREIANATTSLKHAANVPQRVQTSIRGNIATWLGSAALIGVVLAKLPARKKKVYINSKTGKKTIEKKGLLVVLLGLVFQAVRPFLQKMVLEQAHLMADKHLANRSQPNPLKSYSPPRANQGQA